jgi:hypothetical protein
MLQVLFLGHSLLVLTTRQTDGPEADTKGSETTTTTTDAQKWCLAMTTIPMNASSTIEPHQPNNQPQPELSTTYLDEN